VGSTGEREVSEWGWAGIKNSNNINKTLLYSSNK
jgi:hypothetical protein